MRNECGNNCANWKRFSIRLTEPIAALFGRARELEAFGQLGFHENRRTLESTIRVFLVNGVVMLRWVFTAFKNDTEKRIQLRIGVIGVVHMRPRLDNIERQKPILC